MIILECECDEEQRKFVIYRLFSFIKKIYLF